jgi:hypothetical protein
MKSIKEAQNFPLVFHTSNNVTEDIYNKILRFKCLFSLSAFGFLLNIRKVVFKLLNFDSPLFELLSIPYKYFVLILCRAVATFANFKMSTEVPENTYFNEFCRKQAIKNDFELVRDSDFLKWRFLQSPLWQAKILYFYKDSKLCGYMVLRTVEIEGMKFTVVMDFSLNETVNTTQLFCLRCAIIRMALTHGDDMVFTLLNPLSRASKSFIGFPWIKIPEGYMPQRTPMFVHVNDPAMVNLENQSSIHVTLGDLDYF